MKKWGLYLIILYSVTLACGCSDDKRTFKIAVSQCAGGQWREKVNSEMLAAQHLFDHDVKVSIADAHDNPQQQIRQIDSLSETGIDLLVVAPAEAAPMTEVIKRVRRKGIPVVCFDRHVDTDNYDAFIGGNNAEAGELIARYATTLSPRRVLEVTGAMTTSPARERHEGFAGVMDDCAAVDYVCKQANWGADSTYEVVKEALATGWRPDVIFCHNDGMCTGAYRATKEAGVDTEVKILGIDGMLEEGLAHVSEGWQAGTCVYPTHGGEIVRLALNILTGEPYERVNYLPCMMVTALNVDIVSMNIRELTHQNKDLITIHDKLEQAYGLYNTQRKMLMCSLMGIVLLIATLAIMWRAYRAMRRATRQRQQLNEQQTLLYTHAAPQPMRHFLEMPQEQLPEVRSQDVIFAEQLNAAIREKMSNPQLKMDELGESMGLSRVQLYRRVKSITGQSPVELLRQIRLQQGYVLLSTTTKTVSEIAYEVGFGTPAYFSKCFRQQYGKYPTDLRSAT